MSEEQLNQGEAAVAEAEAPAKKAEPIVDESYDESLLIKVKGRVKRPTRPDDTERNLQVQKLQEQIDKSSSRMKEIKGILDSRASGGKVVPPEQQAIRDRIQQLRAEFDTVLLQKKRLQSQSDDKKTEKDKLFAEQRGIKETVRGPSNLQAIDQQIQELEFKLTHESLSAAQEKAMREKKERMQRQDRPAVERLSQVSARIDECKAASDAIRAEILVLNGRLDTIKAARDKEEAKLSELRAAEQEARSDIPALHVEKKELWEVIQALRDKQREIRDAFQKQWEEFKKLDQAWKGWMAQERRKRQEQRKKEYEERQAARKARETEHKPAKFEQEVFTCEQVLSYLRQFVPSEKVVAEERKEVEAPAPGMKLLTRKLDEQADALYSGMGGKKGKGARKAAEKQKLSAETVKKLPQVLPLETLKTFMALGVEAPKSNEDVPKTIETLEAKKKEFEEKRDKAAAEPEPEEEPEEEEGEEEEAAAEAADEAEDEEEEAQDNGDAPLEKALENGTTEKEVDAAVAVVETVAEVQPAANGNIKSAEANGNSHEAAEEEEPEGATDEGVGVKLRVTDDGEVNLELAV